MRLKLRDIDPKWKEYAIAGCICILFFVCISNIGKIWTAVKSIWTAIKPIFIGFVFAYIINPIAEFFRRNVFKGIAKEKIKWNVSAVFTLVIIVLIVALLIAALVPEIVDNITSLSNNYQSYVDSLRNFLENDLGPIGKLDIIKNLVKDMASGDGLINKIGGFLQENAKIIIEKTTTIGKAAIEILIGFIFGIYFLLQKNGIVKEISGWFSLGMSEEKYHSLHNIIEKFNAIFSKYIGCELLDAAIICIANYIVMLCFKMPDALFISVVVGITNLVPTFGPIVGAVIAGFILLLLKPASLLPFLILTLVLQTLDAYYIKPKLFGDVLNVPGIVILIAIILFGKLLGVAGMLLAIPIAAILVYIYKELLIPKLEAKKTSKKVFLKK